MDNLYEDETLFELIDPVVYQWKEAGFLTLPAIRQWSKYFKDPHVAIELFEIFGNRPAVAYAWYKHFKDVDEIEVWAQVFDDPEEAYEWYSAGFDLEEALMWSQLGYTPDDAFEFKKLKISPLELEEKPVFPKRIYKAEPEEYEEIYEEDIELQNLIEKLKSIAYEK